MQTRRDAQKHFDVRGIATAALFWRVMAHTHTWDALLHIAAATYGEVICHYRMFH